MGDPNHPFLSELVKGSVKTWTPNGIGNSSDDFQQDGGMRQGPGFGRTDDRHFVAENKVPVTDAPKSKGWDGNRSGS